MIDFYIIDFESPKTLRVKITTQTDSENILMISLRLASGLIRRDVILFSSLSLVGQLVFRLTFLKISNSMQFCQ